MPAKIKQSAGILAYKRDEGRLYIFLVHPGGPFWANKDDGAWTIPKGLIEDDEETLAAARREFAEETGQIVDGDFVALTPCRQPSRKVIHAFAIEADIEANNIKSNEFELEWPPRSGRKQSFPEVDRGAWFEIDEARRRIQKGQLPILDELLHRLEIAQS
jgi:predicted NUDIX family NTP pyrophosphohydrolase